MYDKTKVPISALPSPRLVWFSQGLGFCYSLGFSATLKIRKGTE